MAQVHKGDCVYNSRTSTLASSTYVHTGRSSHACLLVTTCSVPPTPTFTDTYPASHPSNVKCEYSLTLSVTPERRPRLSPRPPLSPRSRHRYHLPQIGAQVVRVGSRVESQLHRRWSRGGSGGGGGGGGLVTGGGVRRPPGRRHRGGGSGGSCTALRALSGGRRGAAFWGRLACRRRSYEVRNDVTNWHT